MKDVLPRKVIRRTTRDLRCRENQAGADASPHFTTPPTRASGGSAIRLNSSPSHSTAWRQPQPCDGKEPIDPGYLRREQRHITLLIQGRRRSGRARRLAAATLCVFQSWSRGSDIASMKDNWLEHRLALDDVLAASLREP